MKDIKLVFSPMILKLGIWPFVLTILMVLITIILTIILVNKELRRKK